jgi:Periplasmic protein TonB, links inner and outer membranes
MERLKTLVKKVLGTGKKFMRYVGKRGIAFLCIIAVLFSLVSVGIFTSEEKEVKAVAGVDDMVYMALWELTTILGSMAAGADRSEVVTPREAAGITDLPSAENYVRGMTEHRNFLKVFDFSGIKTGIDQCNYLTTLFAKFYLSASYVISNEWMGKLLDQYDHMTDGTSAIDVSNALASVTATVLQFPNQGDDDDDNNEDEDEEKVLDSKYTVDTPLGSIKVLPPNVIPAIFGSLLFSGIYALSKGVKTDHYADQFDPAKEDEGAIGVFHYSFQDWNSGCTSVYSGSSFIDLKSLDLIPSETREFSLSYRFTRNFFDGVSAYGNPEYINYSSSHVYPCLYWSDQNPHLGITTDKGLWDCPNGLGYYYDFPSSSSGNGYVNISPLSTAGYQTYDLMKEFPWSFTGGFNKNELIYLLKNREILDGEEKKCTAPWLIDCGTEENFKRFSKLIQSGEYTLNELLECMADGWKGLKTSTWTGIKDKGATAKKVLESEKGDKYKVTGTKTKPDGTKDIVKGITVDSVLAGMSAQENPSGNAGVGCREFLGDPVRGDEPVIFPTPETNPELFPNPVPGTDPDPNPGVDPDPGINPNPTTKPDPGTDPDSTTKPDPGTDPDSTTNPNPGTDPDPTVKPGGGGSGGSGDGSEDDPTIGSKPMVPGSSSDIQWYERFPFCIPWDIYEGVSALKANTKVPKWRIPFEIKRFGIKEGVTIDLSEYKTLRTICNWFLRILFVLGLVMISRNIIKG